MLDIYFYNYQHRTPVITVFLCMKYLRFSSGQSLSGIWLLWLHGLEHARPPCPLTNSGACSNSCPSVPSNHLILFHPLLLLPSVFPSIKVFYNDLAFHIRWPKYWIFSFSISHSSEYSELISLRIDWFDLLAVQATLKSLLQHHSSKASILRHSAFFMIQLSHLYMTAGKAIALTRWTLSAK